MLIRVGPYKVGDKVILSPLDRNSVALVVTAPDGTVVPITGKSSVTFMPTAAGTWHFSWGASDIGSFEVVEPTPSGILSPTFINRVEVG